MKKENDPFGFDKAINWEKLVEHGSYAEARKHGELRLEGKTYIVEDGDVLVIRHG